MAGKTVSEIASKEDSHSEGWASQKGGLIEKEPREQTARGSPKRIDVEMLRLLEEAVLDAESHGPDIFFKLDAAGHLF